MEKKEDEFSFIMVLNDEKSVKCFFPWNMNENIVFIIHNKFIEVDEEML